MRKKFIEVSDAPLFHRHEKGFFTRSIVAKRFFNIHTVEMNKSSRSSRSLNKEALSMIPFIMQNEFFHQPTKGGFGVDLHTRLRAVMKAS